MKRPVKSNFPRALRDVRKARGIAQEEFDQISSRTYISALERGLKMPTLGKIEQLAELLKVHPLTLLTLSYGTPMATSDVERLFARVKREVEELGRSAG